MVVDGWDRWVGHNPGKRAFARQTMQNQSRICVCMCYTVLFPCGTPPCSPIALTSQHMPFRRPRTTTPHENGCGLWFCHVHPPSSLTRPALPDPKHVAPAAEGASEVRSAPVTLRAAHPALRSAMSASGAEWKQGQQCSAFCTARRMGRKQSR